MEKIGGLLFQVVMVLIVRGFDDTLSRSSVCGSARAKCFPLYVVRLNCFRGEVLCQVIGLKQVTASSAGCVVNAAVALFSSNLAEPPVGAQINGIHASGSCHSRVETVAIVLVPCDATTVTALSSVSSGWCRAIRL